MALKMPEIACYYDDQCEICQAGVSWLRILDRRGSSGDALPEIYDIHSQGQSFKNVR